MFPDSNPITRNLLSFTRVLRRLGFVIASSQLEDALRALEIIGIRNQKDVYQAFYCIFVNRREQIELFDQAFQFFWRSHIYLRNRMNMTLLESRQHGLSHKAKIKLRMQEAVAAEKLLSTRNCNDGQFGEEENADFVQTYSPSEVLRKKDFAEFSVDELEQAKNLLAELNWSMHLRKTGRYAANEKERLLDLRQTVKKNFRNHGEFLELRWRGRSRKPRDIVILCDISGSMARYSRMLLHFMHTITTRLQKIETFVFGTRLTRITRMLRKRDIDEALGAVTKIVADWGGGTRIGAAVKDFNFTWARHALSSGAVVMIISDGWDRGDALLLEHEIQRLSRNCHRLIWLNPLLGHDDYKPLTKGMQTVLPFVDDFLPVHNLESLRQIGEVLGTLNRHIPQPMVP